MSATLSSVIGNLGVQGEVGQLHLSHTSRWPPQPPPKRSRKLHLDQGRYLSEFIEHSALINGLPVEFLMRLLRQESGLNHKAVSRAGAQGVAQFMPGTASERGLTDPFNPFEAIPKAAELLKEYRARFGNLGFAAAAYNAGQQRVRDWLSGRSTLPKETREYVSTITGRSVDDWRQNGEIYAAAEPWLGPLRN